MKFLELEKKNQRLVNESLNTIKFDKNNIKIENTTKVKSENPES